MATFSEYYVQVHIKIWILPTKNLENKKKLANMCGNNNSARLMITTCRQQGGANNRRGGGDFGGAIQIKFNPRNTIIWITSLRRAMMPCSHGMLGVWRWHNCSSGRCSWTQRVLGHRPRRRFFFFLGFTFGKIRNTCPQSTIIRVIWNHTNFLMIFILFC